MIRRKTHVLRRSRGPSRFASFVSPVVPDCSHGSSAVKPATGTYGKIFWGRPDDARHSRKTPAAPPGRPPRIRLSAPAPGGGKPVRSKPVLCVKSWRLLQKRQRHRTATRGRGPGPGLNTRSLAGPTSTQHVGRTERSEARRYRPHVSAGVAPLRPPYAIAAARGAR
jgi:hypothetical protein